MSKKKERELAADFFQMLNVINLFTRDLNTEIIAFSEKRGLTLQRFYVLYSLKLFPNESLKSLAQNLGVSSSSMSLMIDRLVKDGFVYRKEDEEDRRRIKIELTKKSEELIKDGQALTIRILTSWLEEMAEDEQQRLKEAVHSFIPIISNNPLQP